MCYFPKYSIRPTNVLQTALSQVYNLYFIACVDTIHVYQPSFPDQKLSGRPDLILRPPKSRPGLRGTIDPPNPHSITHLIVDFLGTEEILLVSCDDGDVVGYHIHLIQQAIETQLVSDTFERNARDVRNFFHKNVGLSAWGLSVHCEARLIAVSANTHRVTIYAFALAKSSTSSSRSSTERYVWIEFILNVKPGLSDIYYIAYKMTFLMITTMIPQTFPLRAERIIASYYEM